MAKMVDEPPPEEPGGGNLNKMKHYKNRANCVRLQAAAGRLVNGVFDYHRVGFDRRPMTFLTGGMIGEGARGCETIWRLDQKGGELVLEICCDKGVTCQLKESPDNVWRGQWNQFERMPVELSPMDVSEITADSSPQSLFLVSLPRSLSTLVYHFVRNAIGLHEPSWTSDGELLNLDRFALFRGPADDCNRKFISPNLEPKLFCAATELLDQLVNPFGHLYKDVVQPFVVAEWAKRRKVRLIRIKRNVADVAYAMLDCGWVYPSRIFPNTKNLDLAMVQGLLQADAALDAVPAECVNFDELIYSEKQLIMALRALYPKRKIASVGFIDEQFERKRQQILERRKSEKHKMLAELVATQSQSTSFVS